MTIATNYRQIDISHERMCQQHIANIRGVFIGFFKIKFSFNILTSQISCYSTKLSELILEAIELSKIDSRTQNITIEKSFTDNEMIVEIDSVQIQQVILNLIRNAVDAMADCNMEQDKRLIIKIERNAGFARIAINDNGRFTGH
jgi:nitrogen fixation/metabolism regulation signal transduction histidine kinase